MLELIHVKKVYRPKKGIPVTALNGVNLKIQKTGMVFMLGKSGSGKSTLLNVIGGLDNYDEGEIIIKGKSSRNFTQSEFDSYRNTYLGFIFQEYNILEDFTVGANIALALELQGKKATNEAINAILEEVDLAGYGDRKPNELSGGQKQRVAIARALVKSPEIILADEPSGALDSATGIQVFETLKKLSKMKLVIVVSHDREFAEKYGDRIIELSDGQIISDVERVKSAPEHASEGLNIIDSNIIRIRKGYQLTPDDIRLINQYLQETENDAFLSIDGKANDQIKRIAQIDDEGNKDVFRSTDQERLKKINDGNEHFELIRSRFPFKDSLKMGASGLKIKPFRLILTILLSMVAFTLFGLADTMGSYDKVSNMVQSIGDSNIDYLSLTKGTKYVYGEGKNNYYYDQTLMDKEDILRLSEDLGLTFSGVYNEGYYDIRSLIHDTSSMSQIYYLNQLSGLAELSQNDLDELDFTVTGSLPDEIGEVAITSYIFDHFVQGGYRAPDGSVVIKKEDMKSVQDFLNVSPTLAIGEKLYRITAVIDTNFNEVRYESLKSSNDYNDIKLADMILSQELRTITQYSHHAMIFAAQGTINTLVDETRIRINNFAELSYEAFNQSYYNEYVRRYSDLKDRTILLNSSETLGHKEMLINLNSFTKTSEFYSLLESVPIKEEDIPFGETSESYTFSQYFSYTQEQALHSYAEDHYEEAFTNGWRPVDYHDEMMESELVDAFNNYLHERGFYDVNPFLPEGMPGVEVQGKAIAQIFDRYDLYDELQELLNQSNVNLFVWAQKGQFDENKYAGLKIVGFFIPSKENFEVTDFSDQFYVREERSVVLSDTLFEDLKSYNPGYYSYAITKMPQSQRDIRKIVETLEALEGEPTKYQMQNEVSYMIENINSFIEGGSKVFLYVGIGFCVFASLMLLNFIATSISYKKREIGILRAIGARSKDVFTIFFNESLVIALINFVLSTIVTIIVVVIINNTLRNQYGFMVTILRFGIRQVILLLFVSVFVAFIGSFLPVYKTARKKPIDAIRNH